MAETMCETNKECLKNPPKDTAEELLPVFEGFMERKDSGTSDDVRQSVVILMGSLAKHLDASDPKVRPIMRQLIVALNTPSQQVQEAVANCLPPLVVAIKEEAPGMLFNRLLGLWEICWVHVGGGRGNFYLRRSLQV